VCVRQNADAFHEPTVLQGETPWRTPAAKPPRSGERMIVATLCIATTRNARLDTRAYADNDIHDASS
jgi:hypothetical protein